MLDNSPIQEQARNIHVVVTHNDGDRSYANFLPHQALDAFEFAYQQKHINGAKCASVNFQF